MSFLNGALVLGALTALVPLVIHLFNRSRFKVIKWGATHLLKSVLRKNRRQIQLEQWIILIIRCSIPILLALTLARMVVMNWNSFLFFLLFPMAALLSLILVAFTRKTRWFWSLLCTVCLLATILGSLGVLPEWGKETKLSVASGDVPASTVIVLDDSLSMNAANGFSSAQAFISGFLQDMHKQSETSILQAGGVPSPVFDKPTSDHDALAVTIENMDAQGDKISLLSSLDQALSIISKGKNLKREIILLSDFRNPDWSNWDEATVSSFRKRLQSTPNGPELTWVDLGKQVTKNLSVEKIVVSSQTVGIGHPIRIRATLRNYSEESFDGSLQVRLLADRNETFIDEAVVSVGPNATAQVAFTHRFVTSGPKIIHVELIVPDDLPEDNRRSVAVSVIDEIGVLLIDGDPSKEWLKGETDFLKLALTPFKESVSKNNSDKQGGGMKDLIDAKTLSFDQFNKDIQLDGYSLIVLANIEKVDASILESLELFVENGGGILISSGSQLNLDWYNEKWGVKGSKLLPMPIIGTKGSLQNELAWSKITSSYFEHPALSMFNDPRNGSLAEAQIMKWVKLDESKSYSDPKVTVLARLTNGDPLLVEKKFGKGVMMFLGTSIDTDWTNLPARPSFLPFVQQIATYLSERVVPPRTLLTGMPLTHYLSAEEVQSEYKLTIPNRSTRTLASRKRNDKHLVEFTDTRLPGTYELSNEQGIIGKFVVLSSPLESRLEKMDEAQIDKASDTLAENINRIDGRDGDAWNLYSLMDSQRKFGRETWKILLATVLGLVLLEVILLRKFGKVLR